MLSINSYLRFQNKQPKAKSENLIKIKNDSAHCKAKRTYKKRKRGIDPEELPECTSNKAFQNTIEYLYQKYTTENLLKSARNPPIFKFRK